MKLAPEREERVAARSSNARRQSFSEVAPGGLSETRQAELPQLPWREMIGMRNLVTHDNWQVDPAILWRSVTGDLPKVLKQLDAIGLLDS